MALRAQFGVFEVVAALVIYTSINEKRQKKKAVMTPALMLLSHHHSLSRPIIPTEPHSRGMIPHVPPTFSAKSELILRKYQKDLCNVQ